jgi:CSLREA domain-containing protein
VKHDQRGAGFPRQIGERVDKGAVEGGVSRIVTTIEDRNDGACTPTDCTLREAIIAVNLAGVGNVSFAPGLTGTIQLTEALPDIRANMILQGPGAALLTVRRNGGGDYRIFTLNNGDDKRTARHDRRPNDQ